MIPARRHRHAIQLEVCEVSGRLCEQSEMIESDVQGLRGRLVSTEPRNLRRVALAPSWADYRRDGGDVLPFDDTSRESPVGADLTLYEQSED
jgi:hypothetical protein